MKFAFWNAGGMGDASTKLTVCEAWIKNNNPDLIFFEELGSSMENTNQIGELKRKYWISTLDKNDSLSTKNLAVFAKPSVKLSADSTELPFFAEVKEEREARKLVVNPPKRDVLQVSLDHNSSAFYFYGLHANSSYSGGMTAVAAINMFIAHNPKHLIIAGGDYNATGGTLSHLTKKVVPLAYDGTELQFTQWNKDLKPQKFNSASYDFDKVEYAKYCKRLHLTSELIGGWTRCVLPHEQIDYVLCSHGVKIKALANCADDEEWFEILKEFDHAPVLYEI